MRLGLPRVDEPLVSVVMLAYGARDWVEAALRALVANTPPVYEAVILDNASPDGTGDWLAANVEGATLVRNPVNVGFGPGANQAVLSARGRHVCLLNSDALVEPGWLEPLVADLEGIPGCGAVIPRFLNLDWTLQEAGAVVGADGQTMAMGYGDDPDRPWHRFPRFVDYGSGACLLSRRSTFLAAGGFDPCYGLGYYEDVDLCFRLRRDGMRIAYEPRSVVRHVRGASSATTSVLRLREGNAELFRRRWGQALRHRPPLTELQSRPERVVAARDVEAPDRVLVMGARLPRSMDDRAARLVVEMATVAGEARITLVGLDDEGPAEEVSALLDAGIEVIWGINDWDDWMSRCRWHYPVAVVTDPVAGERAAALLSEYQPQALVAIDVDRPDELVAYPPSLVARASAVWERGERAGERVEPLPEPAGVVEGGRRDGAGAGAGLEAGAGTGGLAQALAELGIAPTGPSPWLGVRHLSRLAVVPSAPPAPPADGAIDR